MNDKIVEIWLRMYEEQVRHIRHHETLRTHSTNVVVVLSAGVLGLLSSGVVPPEIQYLLAVFLALINAYGFVVSKKHYERSRLHQQVSSRYRAVISDHSALEKTNLNDQRDIAHREHYGQSTTIAKLPAHRLWSWLHVIIVLLAIPMIFLKSCVTSLLE